MYAAIGTIAVPLSIVTHELGHFVLYQLFGAANIQLHAFSVSADKDAQSSFQIAAANIFGPVISYLTIGLAILFTRNKYIPFWIILGFAAPLGRIVNAVYIYFRMLGYTPSPNFDEFNFSRALNIEPLLLSVITLLIVTLTLVLFTAKAWKAGGFLEIIYVIFSLGIGLAVWNFLGGIILL